MEFSSLISSTAEIRPVGSDLLIIVSSYNAPGLVRRHLSMLSRQTFQRFNVLLVLGVPFDAAALGAYVRRKKFRFGVILARENERRGCSGGFFAGQKYALERGYKYAIMADDDCMPADRGLVAALYRNRARQYVAPTTVFLEGGYRKKGFQAGPTQYSLYSTGIFRKYGLYYLPLFHGADDGEYMERVAQAPFRVSNFTEHPYISGMRLFSMFDRQWLFLLQALVILRGWRATAYNLLQFALMCAAASVFLPGYGRRIAAVMDRMLVSYQYGKAASEGISSGFEKYIASPPKGLFPGFASIQEREASYIDASGASKIISIISGSAALFRKDVVVEKTYSFLRAFSLAIFARRLYVRVGDGRYLLFADNSSLPIHCARLIMFPLALAIQLVICAIFIPVKIARQPRTLGYGLD
ncbi:MAG: hypothetical protein WC717_04275 [Candidatus Micrarchaeia archaeon]|jgi:hypothetical protein